MSDNPTVRDNTTNAKAALAAVRPGLIVGQEPVTEQEALAKLLTFCSDISEPGRLASELIGRFGTLGGVFSASSDQVLAVNGAKGDAVRLFRTVGWICRHQIENCAVPNAIPVAKSDKAATGPEPAFDRSLIDIKPHPLVQTEIPLDVPGQSQLPLDTKPSKREQKSIQDVLIAEGLMALKLAHEAQSPAQLQEILMKRLGQNSMETRRRYAQSIQRWFFPDGLEGILPRVWRAYEDDAIAVDLLRWSYLNQEPIMGRCVAEALFPCETGLVMPATYFDRFLQDCLGETPPEKTRERLKINLKKIGFLERAKGKPDRLLPVVTQKTSLLILVHFLFGAKAVRTVELRTLFANPFWKYLGYKSEAAVRAVLREADATGLIGKYVVADQLEQVTTCFTLDELLARKTRL